MSKKIIIGNWKMNPSSLLEAKKLAGEISKLRSKITLVICPPFVYLPALARPKGYLLGGQDVFWEREGAYTGEISAIMLKKLGVKYVIVGHSERRALGETDEMISRKVKALLKENLIPILCVGERERDHEMFYLSAVKSQVEAALRNVTRTDFKKVIVAYEPVWAIGKNASRQATPEECLEMVIFIKKVLADKFGLKNIKDLKLIYGGSVNPKNAEEFLKFGGVDGFLVGRDSLDLQKFAEIVNIAKLF